MNIALLGCGTVGSAFYALARKNSRVAVKQLLVLEYQKSIDCNQTTDFADILKDPSIDIVVELIGGIHPAYEYVSAAMKAGKHVVTANKHLMCTYYRELLSIAKQNGVSIRCTAAAGGGIPWLTSLCRAAETDAITDVCGIMNGTTNYILSAMRDTGAAYAQSLREAQRLGFAEADPTADVEGYDAQRKLVLSANIGFGVSMQERSVPCFGISAIQAEDIKTFSESGYICKLIAHAHKRNGRISAAVEPMLLDKNSRLAQVSGADNYITLHAQSIGEQGFFGAGAGGFPTASSVLADCIAISRGCAPFYVDLGADVAADNDAWRARYYIRGVAEADIPAENRLGEGWLTRPLTMASAHALIRNLKENNPELFAAALMEENNA